MNFIRGTLTSNGSGLVFDEGNVQLSLPTGHGAQLGSYVGQEVTLGIRPEDIHDPDTIGRNVETVEIAAKVEVVEPMGNEVFLNLTTGKTAFVARVDPLHMPQVDQTVRLVVEIDKAHFFALDNQASLLQK